MSKDKSSTRVLKKSVLQSIISDDGEKERQGSSDATDTTFDMRPDISKRFRTTTVKEIIGKVLHEHLNETKYSQEASLQLTKQIANTVRIRLEGEVYERYKLIVNVVLGEKKGEGVKIGGRCLWDPETDSFATDSFINETLFCVVTVYGILFY